MASESTQCFTGDHLAYVPLAVAGLLVYELGIPVLFAVVLFRTRHQHTQRKVRCRYGSIFLTYR